MPEAVQVNIIDEMIIEEGTKKLQVVNDIKCQLLLGYITTAATITVTELTRLTKMSQPEVSAHLALLRKINLVTTRKERQFVYYSINKPEIERLQTTIEKLLIIE